MLYFIANNGNVKLLGSIPESDEGNNNLYCSDNLETPAEMWAPMV